nr:chondroitin proteoglycan 2-like [Maniola hyperantus]
MRVAAILACAITVVLGNVIEIDIDVELNELGCPINTAIQKILPHKNCNMYNQCSNGDMVERYCAQTLLFNTETLECDWSYNVDCAGRNISESIPEQTESPESDDEDDETCNCDPAEAPEICARSGSDGVLVAHEYCTRLYKCAGGQPVTIRCPRNTFYNPYKKRCDWAENVVCGNRTIPEIEDDDNDGNDNNNENDDDEEIAINHDTPDASEICAQEESNDALIPHDYCNWFYICSEGQAIAKPCPRGLCWNPDKNQCDWSGKVDCGNKTISEPVGGDGNDNDNENDDDEEIAINHDTPDASEICAQEESNDALIPHDYCNWFYMCSGGQPISKICPRDLVWSPPKNQCDWRGKVDCGNKTISEHVDNDDNDNNDENNDDEEIAMNHDTPDASEICAQKESDGVLIAHENCNSFYMCSGGQPISKVCPEGLVWSPTKNQCDWSGNVDCGNKTISEPVDDNDNNNENDDDQEIDGPINDNPAEAAAICAQNNTNGVLVAHQNCDEFYICNLNSPVAMRCADNLLYNPRKERCDWPKSVDCGDRVIPERNNTQSEDDSEESCNNCDPSEAPEICAREGSNGVLVAHENCNQYYKCYAGVPNVLRCMNTLMFDPIKGWCDWPEQVDCGDRITPDNEDSGNDNPANASDICARAGSEGVLVAHEMCNQFYKCSHGKPMELECQSGLLYNPTLGLCDWPINVECGDRQQSSEI